jgi:tripartite-type tricarboxylate transporter receptor subunit TctC
METGMTDLWTILRTVLASGLIVGSAVGHAVGQSGASLQVEPGALPKAVAEALARDLSAALGTALVLDQSGGATASPQAYRVVGRRPTVDPQSAPAPAGLVASAPMVLIGRLSFPAMDGSALLEAASKMQTITVMSDGPGTASGRCAEQLTQVLKVKVTLLPRPTGIMAGEALKAEKADLACVEAPVAIPLLQAGIVSGFAIAGDERVAAIWDVPAAAEIGMPLFTATAWYGLYVPKAVSAEMLRTVNTVLQKRLAADEAALAEIGLTPFPPSHRAPDAHQALLDADAAAPAK